MSESKPRVRNQTSRAPRRRGKIVEKEDADPSVVPIAPDENLDEIIKDPIDEAIKSNEKQSDVKKESEVASAVNEEKLQSTDQQPPFLTYAVEKIKSGLSISHFNLSFQATLKIVGKYEKSMFGSSRITFTENGVVCASMEIEKETKFTLKNKDGAPQCIINVVRPGGNSSLPRHWTVRFVNQDGPTRNLVSETPRVNEKGQYELFFGGKLTMNSVKNAILIDEIEQAEVIGIRKIDKNTLEIDGSTDYDKLTLLSLGIASFLSK